MNFSNAGNSPQTIKKKKNICVLYFLDYYWMHSLIADFTVTTDEVILLIASES